MQQYNIASFYVSWWEEVFLTKQDECIEGVLTFLILKQSTLHSEALLAVYPGKAAVVGEHW